MNVVGYISHINDCINTFDACTFENIYKIEDDLYNISGNECKTHFDIIESHRGTYHGRECQHNSARACFWENISFRSNFGNIFRLIVRKK